METTLILSAPHQKCPLNSATRQCDLAAGTATKAFYQVAKDYENLQCLYLLGDEFRTNHDLNRKVSRHTPYRQELNQLFGLFSTGKIEKCNSQCAVIDIHSFPDEYLIEAGDINFFKQGEIPPEIVLLQGPLDEFRGKSLSNTLHEALSKKKIRSKIIRGIVVNDIMNNASEHKIGSILIEFNERFNKSPDRLYDICEIIVSCLSSM